jgi:DNA-binding transcriptional ArsR family regulator
MAHPADDPPPRAAASDWLPTDPAWTQAPERSLERLELLGELLHPLRGAIVRRSKEPRTVAELAAELDVPVTRLYHHVNRLEAEGLIRVEATRRVGAVVERRYQSVARTFDLDRSLLERTAGAELGRVIGSMFDVTRAALQRELETGTLAGPAAAHEDRTLHSLVTLELTPERRAELLGRLRALVDEFGLDEGDPRASPFRLFVSAFPESR